MEVFRSLFQYVKAWLLILLEFLKLRLMSAVDKDLEIIALRSQLALFNHQVETGKRPKPKATPANSGCCFPGIMMAGETV